MTVRCFFFLIVEAVLQEKKGQRGKAKLILKPDARLGWGGGGGGGNN